MSNALHLHDNYVLIFFTKGCSFGLPFEKNRSIAEQVFLTYINQSQPLISDGVHIIFNEVWEANLFDERKSRGKNRLLCQRMPYKRIIVARSHRVLTQNMVSCIIGVSTATQ